MRITWSIPVRGERLNSSRGDLIRARFLIQALEEEGHDVVVVEDAARVSSQAAVFGYRRFVKAILPGSVAMILRDLGRWLQSRRHGMRVADVARKHRSEILVETQVGFAVSGALASRKAKIPFLLDDCSPASEEKVLGAGLPSLAGYVLQQQVKAAGIVIAACESAKQALIKEEIPAEKIRIVSNGINLEPCLATERSNMRKQLCLRDRYVIVFAGSFMPWHETQLLIHALDALQKRKRDVHLLLVGEGPALASTLQLGRRMELLDRITSTGAVAANSIPKLLCACDAGILPGTNAYGQPMKLLEYAAAGLPSVAPDVPPVHEILEPGVTGLVFAPGKVESLSDTLEKLFSNQEWSRSLGEAARRKVATESWKAKGCLLSRYIHDLVGVKQPSLYEFNK